jgi:maltose alpha-D-glucosyltransferase/alpha-amylase
VLLTRNDFVITDFEGEPARPLAERRQKHSPLRDVAGMLRSFNYVRWAALRRAARDGEDLAALTPPAAAWETEARRAFLAAYDAARAAGLYASFAAVRGVVALAEPSALRGALRAREPAGLGPHPARRRPGARASP